MLHKTNTGGKHVVIEIHQRSLLFFVFLILTHNVLTIVGTNTCISTNVTHACKVGRRQILPSEKNMLVFFKICQNLNNCISVSALCDDSATYTQISTRTFFIGEHNLLRDAECLLTPKLEEKPSNLSKQQLDSDLVN